MLSSKYLLILYLFMLNSVPSSLQYLPPIMVTVHVQDMSFANATLGSRHSTMISASVNVSYFFILSPFFLTL